MPFTFAHPAAVLPLKSKIFNLSGLILGSMAPDIIYFVLFSPSSSFGHTFLGFILFNLPICFILNHLFYKYIQELFIYILPDFISTRYAYMVKNKNMLSNKTEIFKFLYSCFFGMATHVFWDGFTHKTGFFVQNIGFLKNSISLFDVNIPYYKILQHGSTIVGFLIISVYVYINRDRARDRYHKSYCFIINKKKVCLSIISITAISTTFFTIIFLKINGFIGIGRIIIIFINSIFFHI